EKKARMETHYRTVDTVDGMRDVVARARRSGHLALDTAAAIDPAAPVPVDPLRSTLVAISVALAPGEAYYLPLAHVDPPSLTGQTEILAGGRVAERADDDEEAENGEDGGDDGEERSPPRRSSRGAAARPPAAPRSIAAQAIAA